MLKGFQSELVAQRFRSLVQLYSGRCCFFLILFFFHGVLPKLNTLQYVFGGVLITYAVAIHPWFFPHAKSW